MRFDSQTGLSQWRSPRLVAVQVEIANGEKAKWQGTRP